MDLHVVEVRVAHTWGRPGGTLRQATEWEPFRAAGIYDAAADVGFAPVSLAEDELAPDHPVDDLALLGGRIAEAVVSGSGDGRRTMMIGGNCACVPGMVGGLQQAYGPGTRVGLVWVDAHADMNTPTTTPNGFYGGMPVAVVTGLCHPTWRAGAGIRTPLGTDQVVMAGVRKLSLGERQIIDATDVTLLPLEAGALTEAVERLADQVDVVYLHVDLDILDPSLIPSHMAHVPDGAGIEETVAALGAALDTGRVDAFALVSLYATREGGDRTVDAAIEILRPCIERWAAAPVAA